MTNKRRVQTEVANALGLSSNPKKCPFIRRKFLVKIPTTSKNFGNMIINHRCSTSATLEYFKFVAKKLNKSFS